MFFIVPVKWAIWTMCLGVNLPDPALSGGQTTTIGAF